MELTKAKQPKQNLNQNDRIWMVATAKVASGIVLADAYVQAVHEVLEMEEALAGSGLRGTLLTGEVVVLHRSEGEGWKMEETGPCLVE